MKPVIFFPLISILIIAAPMSIAAKTVSVFIGPYKSVWEEDISMTERAAGIAEAIRERVVAAGSNAAIVGKCSDVKCLSDISNDIGIVVEVTASDASYEISIRLSDGKTRELSRSGTFNAVTADIVDASMELLKPQLELERQPTPKATVEKHPPTLSSPSSVLKKDSGRRKLRPPLFWSMLGISLGFTGAWVGLNAHVGKRYDRLADGEKDRDYWEASKRLQFTGLVFCGIAALAVTAAAILLPFTDFKRRNKASTVALGTGVAKDGGVLVLKGHF